MDVHLLDGQPFLNPIHHEDRPNPGRDGSHWRLLPWGSVPFGGISAGDRNRSVASAAPSCPQGFSPSRRFTTTRTSWLCFTPHPPLGFWSSELFPLRQPRYLSISVALLPFRQRPGVSGEPFTPDCPCLLSPASPIFSGEQNRDPVAHPCVASDIILAGHPTFVEWPGPESGPHNPEVWRAAFTRCAPHP
jgi:hypothetical protein